MTERIVALVDPTTRKIDPGLIPGGGGGGPQSESFAFAGTLVVGSGAFYVPSPPAEIRLMSLTITLGILGTGGGSVTAALLANGSQVGAVTVAAGSRVATVQAFDPAVIPASQLLSVDISAVPGAGATRPGNAVVQAVWEYT
ncbi:hypothetical protein [Microbacterium rhizomatis]|uniref:Uncharacterized protein n=1 Tax=Microbacterium rhizomatis TaxID=1631477 RepID=A0A5J5J407_9MICO|nr:hypothetical protein [Microbacterium rhizomatis]KAA9110189.1 hypothetical protein F6B43_00315 [Microbacterium rhizomatis]